MPVNGRLRWQELLDEIARRMGEIDVAGNTYPSGVAGQANMPYNLKSDVEDILLEVSQASLRELTFDEIQDVGLRGVNAVVGTVSPIVVPENAIGLISSIIDLGVAAEVTPAMFYQGITRSAVFMFAARNVYYNGTNAAFEIAIEPTLANWRLNAIILPPAYDNKRIDEVCHILEVGDYLPAGRL